MNLFSHRCFSLCKNKFIILITKLFYIKPLYANSTSFPLSVILDFPRKQSRSETRAAHVISQRDSNIFLFQPAFLVNITTIRENNLYFSLCHITSLFGSLNKMRISTSIFANYVHRTRFSARFSLINKVIVYCNLLKHQFSILKGQIHSLGKLLYVSFETDHFIHPKLKNFQKLFR